MIGLYTCYVILPRNLIGQCCKCTEDKRTTHTEKGRRGATQADWFSSGAAVDLPYVKANDSYLRHEQLNPCTI